VLGTIVWATLACRPQAADRPGHMPDTGTPQDTGTDGGSTDGGSTDGGSTDGGSTDGGSTTPGPSGTGASIAGTTTYAWLVPECALEGGPAAVLFTMHGSGGTGASMVAQWRSLAERECFIVIGQDSKTGTSWNFGTDVEGMNNVIEQLKGLYELDEDRLYLHGYSAGAHWAWVVGLLNSDVFAGLAVYAGTMTYAVKWEVWPEDTGGPIPVLIGHGTADTTVPYSEAQAAFSRLQGAGWPVELWTASGGDHAYDPDHQEPAWELFQTWPR